MTDTEQNDEKILIKLGNRLKAAREKRHMTQAEVAAASDVNVNYYAQIERGEVNTSVEKLQKIMRTLKIKSLDLL